MSEQFDSILSRIADGTLLPIGYYEQLNCDLALDARDNDRDFVARWSYLFQQVESRWADALIDEEQRTQAEEIRKEAFLTVSRATGQHEIASYASDDLDLVVRARLLGLTNPWLDDLWQAYDRGEFPSPSKPSQP